MLPVNERKFHFTALFICFIHTVRTTTTQQQQQQQQQQYNTTHTVTMVIMETKQNDKKRVTMITKC